MCRLLHVTVGLILALGSLAPHAANVSGGYTNSFTVQPAAGDWTAGSIAGGAGDIGSTAQMDSSIQSVTAAGISAQLNADVANPPGPGAVPVWSSAGGYIQSRPTSVGAQLILCTLVNNLGVDAIGLNLLYDFAEVAPLAEEVNGHRVYYSLTGGAGSWTAIPALSSAAPGRLSVSLNLTWPNGSPLYLLWADDNSAASSPDTAMQLDNFSAFAIPGTQTPVTVTAHPTNQSVAELSPVTFTVSLSGYLPPTLQWYSNNVAIPGATNLSYTIPEAPLSYNGLNFKVIAQNVANGITYTATSTEATLTVTADTTAPALLNAVSSGGGVVQVIFSEPITLSSATSLGNYAITNLSGGLVITNAILASDRTNVILYTHPQSIGAQYTLTVNGVRDVSSANNLIAPNSQLTFTAFDYSTTDIGSPALPGSFTALSSTAFDVTGSGSDFGGTADQFTFGSQQKAGDFDVKVRVNTMGFSDPWAKAALMARETLNSNSVFAASVATPLMVGSFFQSRATTGSASTTVGTFPANFPDMWLRLKRVGNVFTGYAGNDGQRWVQLGSVTLNIGSVSIGLAVTSHDVAETTTAQFRDYGNTDPGAIVVSAIPFITEQLSAAARTTPVVISEIMYKPASSNANLEFIELYNSNPFFEDISGYRLSGDIDYKFPSNTFIQGGSFLLVAKDPAALQAAYGVTGVLGPFANSNSLPASGLIRLRSDVDAIMLNVDYSNKNPWPVGADGTGHSLVLARASYGQNVPRSWEASDQIGGSPGRHEPLRSRTGGRAVMINEILAHTDLPQLDFIELYNYSTQAVDISGCYLSDSASTNKFRIPDGTTLAGHGYVSFSETTLGFALGHKGETVFFRSADGVRMLDAVQFEPQENGVSYGRYPDGSSEFYRLTTQTPGTTNSTFRVDDIVINEIMFAHISENVEDDYVELYNKGTNAVNLSGWRFTAGVDFTFPANTVLAPDGYVVVAKNRSRMLAKYPNLNLANTYGDFSGNLSRDGERLALAKPEIDVTTNTSGTVTTNTLYIVVEEVTYGTGGRWCKWANQGGSSLELIDPRSNHRLAYNWGDSDETSKALWTPFQTIGLIDTGSTQGGSPIDRLEVMSLGESEYLLDNIEARNPANTANLLANGTFESGALSPWVPQGNHIRSTLEPAGDNSARSMHVRTGGNGDSGANRIRVPLTAGLTIGQPFLIKGSARWLRGWPETTLRIKGGHLEAYVRMAVPENLGSPGARNSIAKTNSAPAIYSVVHSPVLPQAGDNVVIVAGAQDPDGIANVTLFYRVDSASPPAFTTLAMNDNGVAGDAVAKDGIYSATIPAQASGTMVSFYVEATDSLSATSQLPAGAVATTLDGQRRECLVRWGDPIPNMAFAAYRLWMSRANVNSYINRPALSNQDVDGTMVVGNTRVIYNMQSHYSNSPYHQGQNATPESGGQHFDIHMPLDDKYLGTENFNKVHAPGNGAFDDATNLREQTAYWLARKLGMPYLNRRYVAMYVNGNRKGGPNALQEDTQRPGGELIEEFFPDETEGHLYKLQPWFEFDDVTVTGGGAAVFDNKLWCTLTRNMSTNAHKLTRYRQNYLSRSVDGTANDYTNVIALIEAASVPTSNPSYWQNISGLIDIEQWAHIFAVEHAVGNWDSFGGVNAQNMYGYKPKGGKWKLMIWDLNIVLNNPNTGGSQSNPPGGNLFDVQSGQDPNMAAMEAFPPFRRAWYRAYKELVAGPMNAVGPGNVNEAIDAKYRAMVASGVNPPLSAVTAVKTFISTARTGIAAAVAAVEAQAFTINNPNVNASSNLVTLTGTAPLDVTQIWLNGLAAPVTWTGITTWSVTVPVTNSTQFSVVGMDKNGRPVGSTNTANITFTPAAVPDARNFIVFNEVMYNPAPGNPGAEYIELHNTHSNFAFNIGGWRINGIDYTFPSGAYLAPRAFLVLAKDRVAFNIAYGATVAVFDQFTGNLQGDGESLTLLKPAATTNEVDLVIDRLRYENVAPWSTNADNSGSSLQLIDPNQDNSRVANWISRFTPATYTPAISTPSSPRDGWRFFSATGTSAGGAAQRLLIFLGEAGSAIIDDLSIVLGPNAAVGSNYVANGDFESPLVVDPSVTNRWAIGTNYTNSLIISDLVHSGNGALKIIGESPGAAVNPFIRVIYQFVAGLPAGSNATLSFWYWATNSATNLYVRVLNSSGLTTGPANGPTNINVFITPSNYVPAMQLTAATNAVSPGSNNTVLATMTPFAPLWINEVQAENLTGLVDSYGERDPWIEIYNTSTNTVSLNGLYLSSSYTNYTNWAFPSGSSIGPTQFLVVFCDAQPVQTTASEHHTSFRLPPAVGGIALTRLSNGAPQVLDYVNYNGLHSDRSFGSFPDGQPFDRQEFFYVTPRGTNNGSSAPLVVFINEWMVANTNGIVDPADNDRDDWFELYNPGTNAVDIAGYYLTDTLSDKTKYLITTNGPHIIPPQGYLLVWADNEVAQNTSAGVPRTDLHVNFQLAKALESIGLFAASGLQIDAINFTNQTDDVSQGRIPDGSANIVLMPGTASPRGPNYIGQGNVPPVLGAIGNKVIYLGQTLSFLATATDVDVPAQILGFVLVSAPSGASITPSGAFSWTPTSIGTNTFTVRVLDSGSPSLNDSESITVEVLNPPGFTSSLRNGSHLELTWGTRAGWKYAIDYKADLNAAQWTPMRTNTAAGLSLSYTNAMTNGTKGFFRIRTVE